MNRDGCKLSWLGTTWPSACRTQELKDHMRAVGEVLHANVLQGKPSPAP